MSDHPEARDFAPDDPRRHLQVRFDEMEGRLIEFLRQSAARIESPFVEVDAELLKTAQEITGVMDASALVSLALKAIIEHESARRLAALGGTLPDFPDIPPRD